MKDTYGYISESPATALAPPLSPSKYWLAPAQTQETFSSCSGFVRLHTASHMERTYLLCNRMCAESAPEDPKREPSSFLSLGAFFWLGLSSTARKRGGSPYRRMLSTNSRMAQIWIQALKACCQHSCHQYESRKALQAKRNVDSVCQHAVIVKSLGARVN